MSSATFSLESQQLHALLSVINQLNLHFEKSISGCCSINLEKKNITDDI
jgi:hypothetical protein